MRSAAIAIFTKTPGISPVKTRLANCTSRRFAQTFYLRSLQATRAVVSLAVNERQALTPYWAVAERAALGHRLWRDFAQVWQGEGGLGEKLARVYEKLRQRHNVVILIGADSPLLTCTHLLDSHTRLTTHTNGNVFVLGRARDGGFYLFGGSTKISKEIWTGVPYSDHNTANELRKSLRRLGTVQELEELLDIDTLDDLLALPNTPAQANLLRPQRELLRWIREIKTHVPTIFKGGGA